MARTTARRRSPLASVISLCPEVDAASPPTVCDPSCGAGSLLLAAADRIRAAGTPPEEVARHLLFGADVDPLAAAVTETAIALWSGGVAPASGHVVTADPLDHGS